MKQPPAIWPPVPDWLSALVLVLAVLAITGWLGPWLDTLGTLP